MSNDLKRRIKMAEDDVVHFREKMKASGGAPIPGSVTGGMYRGAIRRLDSLRREYIFERESQRRK